VRITPHFEFHSFSLVQPELSVAALAHRPPRVMVWRLSPGDRYRATADLVPDVEEAPVDDQINVTLAALFAALAKTFNQADDTFDQGSQKIWIAFALS
jgi:hypothetical protein